MKDYINIILLIIIDQISKIAVRATMELGQSIDLLGSFFSLTYVRNFGAAWNSFSGKTLILIGIPVVAMIAGLYVYAKYKDKKHWTLKASLMMIIAGGAGNMIDRVFIGYVTDMFDFHFWPVFNIADIAVVVGCGLLFIHVLFFDKEKANG